MTINDLFKKGNKLFIEKNLFGGLDVFKEIWLQFPNNKRLEEEINKKIKKAKSDSLLFGTPKLARDKIAELLSF